MFISPGEIAFNLFSIPVYWYGITLALGAFAGCAVAYFLFKRYFPSNNANIVLDYSPLIIFAGILGARLYYCLVNFGYYLAYPLEIFDIRQGGLSVHGMILTGILALFYVAKRKGINFGSLFDVFTCGAALGQSIGRWGNFFNSEAFGSPTDLPWKLYIPPSHRPELLQSFEYFHPTFLYESILNFLIFLVLLVVIKKKYLYPGVTAVVYLFLYSVVRLFVEAIRVDSAFNVGNMPIAQLVSVCLIVVSVIFYFLLHKKCSKCG